MIIGTGIDIVRVNDSQNSFPKKKKFYRKTFYEKGNRLLWGGFQY